MNATNLENYKFPVDSSILINFFQKEYNPTSKGTLALLIQLTSTMCHLKIVKH